jgi:hypothetical protein
LAKQLAESLEQGPESRLFHGRDQVKEPLDLAEGFCRNFHLRSVEV